MGITFSEQVTLTSIVCIECGITFASPRGWSVERRRDHQTFYCPNGHGQCYGGESEEERLKRELARQKAETSLQREAFFAEQRNHERTQKELRRLEKRTAAGVCPCCQRTFAQLSRHMKTKHIQFVKEHGIPVASEAA